MFKRSQRLVAFLAAVIILFEVAAVPQKAKAVAVSTAVVASVIMIMTACGVSYWASTQGDAEDYITTKIGEYFDTLQQAPSSLLEWLGISDIGQLFVVLTGGVVRFEPNVANPILEFVDWLFHDSEVESGGEPVDIGAGSIDFLTSSRGMGDFPGQQFSAVALSEDTIQIDFAFARANVGTTPYQSILVPVSTGCVVTCIEYDGPEYNVGWGCQNSSGSFRFPTGIRGVADSSKDLTSYSDSYIEIAVHCTPTVSSVNNPVYVGATMVFSVPTASGIITGADNRITPSSAVAVAGALTEDQTFDVAPNVPISDGMTVDDVSDSVLSAVSSGDGITSDGEAVTEPETPSFDLSGILEALGSILDAILSIPSHIANGVQSIVATLGQKVDSFKDAVHGFLTTFDNYLHDISQRVNEMAHDITMLISDRLEYLFVPDEIYVQNYLQSIMHLFDGRVGILTFPLSVFVDFLTRFSSISDGDHSFHWGNINEPFSGRQVIAAGSYNLDDAVASSPMSTVYSVYLVVVKAVIAFWFLRLCQRKYELIVNGH